MSLMLRRQAPALCSLNLQLQTAKNGAGQLTHMLGRHTHTPEGLTQTVSYLLHGIGSSVHGSMGC